MLTAIWYRQSSATVATVSSFPAPERNLALVPHLDELLRPSPPSPPHGALRQPQRPGHRSSTAKPRRRLSLATRRDDVSSRRCTRTTTRTRRPWPPSTTRSTCSSTPPTSTSPFLYYFDPEGVALKNFAKHFFHRSHEEKEHAEKLMKLQNQRGGPSFRISRNPTVTTGRMG